MRVTGLATGLDIDGLVQQMMQAQRAPLTKLVQKKQIFEWQRDTYKEVNTKLTAFRNDTLFNMKLDSYISPKKATIIGNSSAVQVSASGNATAGSLVIEVHTLAKAASNFSSGAIGTGDFTAGKKLSESFAEGHLNYAGIENPDTSEFEMLDTYKFKINGTEVTIDTKNDTLNTVIAKINQETNVTAFYDDVTGKVSLMTKETGSVNNSGDGLTITLEDVEGDFLQNVLKIQEGSAEEIAAVDASVTINGMTTSRTNNSFTINGVQVTLTGTTEGSPVTVNVSNDVDGTIEKIKDFIEKYNETLSYLTDLSRESKYRDFPPLTDEQKKEMSEKEIELWEEKARSGLLRNDMIVTKAISSMRMSAMSFVDTGNDDYNTLSAIGIKTGGYAENGKLYLSDENKLREALEKDPQAVMKLFNGSDEVDKNKNGIATRMHDALKGTLDEIYEKAGRFITLSDDSPLSNQINDLADDIAAMNKRLMQIETNYYNRFAQMESAINRYNAQAMQLASYFGGMINNQQ